MGGTDETRLQEEGEKTKERRLCEHHEACCWIKSNRKKKLGKLGKTDQGARGLMKQGTRVGMWEKAVGASSNGVRNKNNRKREIEGSLGKTVKGWVERERERDEERDRQTPLLRGRTDRNRWGTRACCWLFVVFRGFGEGIWIESTELRLRPNSITLEDMSAELVFLLLFFSFFFSFL